MTPTMQRTYQFLESYIGSKGYSPSFSEIQEGIGATSKSAVHRVLVQLHERGHIEKRNYRARSIKLVKHNCPHCGGAL